MHKLSNGIFIGQFGQERIIKEKVLGKPGEERDKVIAPWNIYDLNEFKNRKPNPPRLIGIKPKKKVRIQKSPEKQQTIN